MSNATDTILARIRDLQEQLDAEFDRRREAFLYRLDNGRVIFDAEARRRQREMRVRLSDFLRNTRPMVVADLAIDLQPDHTFRGPRFDGHALPAHLLSHLPHPTRAPRRLHPHRPPPPAISERAAKTELRLLRLLQRRHRLCAGSGRPDRSLLVPDQTRRAHGGPASLLRAIRGFTAMPQAFRTGWRPTAQGLHPRQNRLLFA